MIRTTRWQDGAEVKLTLGEGTTVERHDVYLYDGLYNDVATYLDTDGVFKSLTYGGGYYGSGEGNSATVDATPDVVEAWNAYSEYSAQVADRKYRFGRADIHARQVWRGAEVEVVRGRKVPVGTVATVGWYGQTRFGKRVRLDLADGSSVWTDPYNVQVTLDQYLADMAKAGYADPMAVIR